MGRRADQRYGREILQGIVADCFENMRSNSVCIHMRHQQVQVFGMAAFRELLGRQHAGGAWLVFNHDRTPPKFAELITHDTCKHTGAASWCPTNGEFRSEEKTSELQSLMRKTFDCLFF